MDAYGAYLQLTEATNMLQEVAERLFERAVGTAREIDTEDENRRAAEALARYSAELDCLVKLARQTPSLTTPVAGRIHPE